MHLFRDRHDIINFVSSVVGQAVTVPVLFAEVDAVTTTPPLQQSPHELLLTSPAVLHLSRYCSVLLQNIVVERLFEVCVVRSVIEPHINSFLEKHTNVKKTSDTARAVRSIARRVVGRPLAVWDAGLFARHGANSLLSVALSSSSFSDMYRDLGLSIAQLAIFDRIFIDLMPFTRDTILWCGLSKHHASQVSASLLVALFKVAESPLHLASLRNRAKITSGGPVDTSWCQSLREVLFDSAEGSLLNAALLAGAQSLVFTTVRIACFELLAHLSKPAQTDKKENNNNKEDEKKKEKQPEKELHGDEHPVGEDSDDDSSEEDGDDDDHVKNRKQHGDEKKQ